ncbi:MAG: UvrD-helicase domain-containing protein [Planctomycetota bacterium]
MLDSQAMMADLTPDQRRAVERTEGPVLILAAAGSGKTRVITRRIAHLLAMGTPAWSILALTFTNKAAAEMRERVEDLLATQGGAERIARGLTITTFHSLCARLLRRFAPLMEGRPDWPINGDFTIYDTDDQMALIKRALKSLHLETSHWPPRSCLSAISAAKNELKDARTYEHEAADFYARTNAKIYAKYQEGLAGANAVDFDDLLLLTVRLLRENDEARETVQQRYRYLMIDEYQDTNRAQFVLSTLLIGREEHEPANVCVVGDPDQSIYGWRGADITNILDFESVYDGCEVIALGQNFRSTAPILAAADHLIQHNAQRKHKPLYTTREGGDAPRILMCRDEQHEGELITDWVRELVGEDKADLAPLVPSPEGSIAWKDIAIMYRNNALSRVVEDALRRAGVPYVIARGTAFYQREEVRDALSYLRVVANPADEVSLRRIVNKPARKIGKTTLSAVDAFAATQGITLYQALRRADETSITPAAKQAIARFIEIVDGWTAGGTFMGTSVPTTLQALVERVVRESGLEAHYKRLAEKNRTEAEEAKVANLGELVSSAAQFDDEYDTAADPAFDPFDFMDQLTDEERAAADTNADATEEMASEGNFLPADPEPPELLARLRAYLEQVSLVADADRVDPASGAVTLLTLHAAKGLEFEAVAIIGFEEGTLPGMRAMDSESELEEERRLAFVGITRAKQQLLITSTRYRTIRGISERCIPSRFLDELPTDHIEVEDRADVSEGLGRDWGEDDTAEDDPNTFDDIDPRAVDEEFDQRPMEERLAELKPKKRRSNTPATITRGMPRRSGSTRASLSQGQRVRHPQFGEGTVVSVTSGMNARARIEFDDAGPKTLILQYARLEML